MDFYLFLNYLNVYISTISFLSKVPSKFSNYSSKFASIVMNFIKLEGDSQTNSMVIGPIFVRKKLNFYFFLLLKTSS
jgi:hypothetical protein